MVIGRRGRRSAGRGPAPCSKLDPLRREGFQGFSRNRFPCPCIASRSGAVQGQVAPCLNSDSLKREFLSLLRVSLLKSLSRVRIASRSGAVQRQGQAAPCGRIGTAAPDHTMAGRPSAGEPLCTPQVPASAGPGSCLRPWPAAGACGGEYGRKSRRSRRARGGAAPCGRLGTATPDHTGVGRLPAGNWPSPSRPFGRGHARPYRGESLRGKA